MDNRFILTAYGKDRPGIVSDVTRILYQNGCNLEDTSMTRLVDEFTLILLFTCPAGECEKGLQESCSLLEQEKNISAFIRPLQQKRDLAEGNRNECTIHVEGEDQAGIVYKISQYLADNEVNILDLKSTVKASPGSGTAIYMMGILVQVPSTLSFAKLEEGLTEVAEELHVDIALSR